MELKPPVDPRSSRPAQSSYPATCDQESIAPSASAHRYTALPFVLHHNRTLPTASGRAQDFDDGCTDVHRTLIGSHRSATIDWFQLCAAAYLSTRDENPGSAIASIDDSGGLSDVGCVMPPTCARARYSAYQLWTLATVSKCASRGRRAIGGHQGPPRRQPRRPGTHGQAVKWPDPAVLGRGGRERGSV